MKSLTTKPNHGEQLVDSEGKALVSIQLFFDEIVLVANSDRSGLNDYTVATLPDASSGYGMIMVTNASGGPVPAFSDLTNWRRVTDRAVIT